MMGCLKGGQIENITVQITYSIKQVIIRLQIMKWKPCRRVAPESSLVVGSTGPSSSGRVAPLLPSICGGTHWECLPIHNSVGGGVPPNERLPHPPHSGPLETRQRGEPSLTPPRSPHFAVGPTVGHHPHGRWD